MAEVQQVEVHSASHMRNQARVNRDEEELRELMKQAGITQEDETKEETAEAEPDSKEPEAESVQAEGNPKQEEGTAKECLQKDLRVGDRVFIKDLNLKGTVIYENAAHFADDDPLCKVRIDGTNDISYRGLHQLEKL